MLHCLLRKQFICTSQFYKQIYFLFVIDWSSVNGYIIDKFVIGLLIFVVCILYNGCYIKLTSTTNLTINTIDCKNCSFFLSPSEDLNHHGTHSSQDSHWSHWLDRVLLACLFALTSHVMLHGNVQWYLTSISMIEQLWNRSSRWSRLVNKWGTTAKYRQSLFL